MPKPSDKLVKPNIVTTRDPRSHLGVCVTTSLEIAIKDILGKTITTAELDTKAFLITKKADWYIFGLSTAQTIQLINSFCETKSLTSFKSAIDDGYSVLTDILIGTTTRADLNFPNDRTKDITVFVTHSVTVIGYDADGNYIYIDPALGIAQVTEESNLNKSYALVITDKK